MNKLYNVEASVHKPIGKGFRVKASVLDFEMHINGMVVYPPSQERNEWTVYTPTIGRARIIEFASKSSLWKEVQEACIDAVKLYMSDSADVDDAFFDLSAEEQKKKLSEDLDKAFKDFE